MAFLKARLLALALIAISAVIIYINWHQLLKDGSYSLKMAAFGPLIGVGGLYLLFFPGQGGKPTTTKNKIMVLVVFTIGIVGGLVNWYLMDPGFFGR
jgi:hypothetical protein